MSASGRSPARSADVGRIFGLSLTAALNPTLLAAVTVMLTLLSPKRLLLGYLVGAAVTSISPSGEAELTLEPH